MTLVVDILNRAARHCSVTPPSSWLTANELEHVGLRDDYLLEAVEDVLDRIDMPTPIGKQYTIPSDGSEVYALPSDFRRLARSDLAVYETTTTRRRAWPITSDGEWTNLKEIGSTGAERFYRLSGYDGAWSIGFYDEPSAAIEMIVSYVSQLWVASSAGALKGALTDAGDVSLLPRRLLESGIVWRFRRRNGLAYEDVLREYEMHMQRMSDDTRGRRTISYGATPSMRPWQVPVPDFIPSS